MGLLYTRKGIFEALPSKRGIDGIRTAHRFLLPEQLLVRLFCPLFLLLFESGDALVRKRSDIEAAQTIFYWLERARRGR
jgi:hypothetical protein